MGEWRYRSTRRQMETSDVTHINHTDQVTTIHQLLLHRNTSRGRHDGMIHFYST